MFAKRSTKQELLDQPNVPFGDVAQNMAEIAVINKWLGGYSINLKAVKLLTANWPKGAPLHIAEIGCGDGNNLRALAKSFLAKKFQLRFTGIDFKSECIDYAKNFAAAYPVDWVCSDYRKVVFDQESKPDIIFSSLFCHHFTKEELVEQWKWMLQQTNVGCFINDLQRHPLAYASIFVLSRLSNSSYLFKHDAPLSVLRGFKRSEIEEMLQTAGLRAHAIIFWQWAFRYLIILKK